MALGDQAAAAGYTVSYVGSQAFGPTTYGNGTEAYPGYRIDELIVQTAGAIATYNPELVTLYVGMNDCIQNYLFSAVGTRYRALINQVRTEKPTAKVALVMLNPSSDGTVNGRINTLNALLPGIAAEYQAVSVISAANGFDTATQLNDTVHPNCGGYNQVGASMYYNGIENILRNR